MGLLGDVMAADGPAFADVDGYGEAVVYTPKGGGATPIDVVVIREELEIIGETGDVQLTDTIEIEVQKQDIATVVVNADTVAMKRRLGGATTTLTIRSIVAQDEGFWRLRVN